MSDNEYSANKENGYSKYRFKLNPAERIFSEEWDKLCKISGMVEYLLSDTVNVRKPVPEVTKNDVNTIIQWLGSPCGQSFLREVKDRCKKEGIPFLGDI